MAKKEKLHEELELIANYIGEKYVVGDNLQLYLLKVETMIISEDNYTATMTCTYDRVASKLNYTASLVERQAPYNMFVSDKKHSASIVKCLHDVLVKYITYKNENKKDTSQQGDQPGFEKVDNKDS